LSCWGEHADIEMTVYGGHLADNLTAALVAEWITWTGARCWAVGSHRQRIMWAWALDYSVPRI
jgi:hypothetical protein